MWQRWQRRWPRGQTAASGLGLEDTGELLRKLTAVAGPSGFEKPVADTVEELAKECTDETWRDTLGNVFLRIRGADSGSAGRIVLAAHMDEVGFLVSRVEKQGYLRLQTLGRPDLRCLPGQKVEVWGLEKLRGAIGVPAVHLQGAGQQSSGLTLDSLFVDTGVEGSRVHELVRPGDAVVLERNFSELRHGQVSARALDNRAGVAVLLQCLRRLSYSRPRVDVVGVATVQEELGARGAGTAAETLDPRAALVIDVCHGRSPGLPEDETFGLGAGPVLTTGPHVHPQLLDGLKQTALKERLSYQMEADPSPAGTDAFRVQIASQGIPTALISVPVRYMHTPVETVAIHDVNRAAELTGSWVGALGPGWWEELSCW